MGKFPLVYICIMSVVVEITGVSLGVLISFYKYKVVPGVTIGNVAPESAYALSFWMCH